MEFLKHNQFKLAKVVPGDTDGSLYPTPKAPNGKSISDLNHLSEKVTRTITYVTEDKNGNNRQEATSFQKQIV